MTPTTLLDHIVTAASTMTPIATVRGYVFGSILRPDFHWTDVDILIVCDDAGDIGRVRPALASVCTNAPIDLLLMSAAEERELDFVIGQSCELLFELAPSHVRRPPMPAPPRPSARSSGTAGTSSR
jgi:hypothetical protein